MLRRDRPDAKDKKKKKDAIPDMQSLLDTRDYTGALTLIEFERKIFLDKKQASGWQARPGGEYEWVEGGSSQMSPEEQRHDDEQVMWLAYAAYHLGSYQQALDAYQGLVDRGTDDQMLHVYIGCCLERLGWHQEAEEAALKGPACPLQNRLLFHLAHRLNDESKLMAHHQKLADTTLDQLSLASIHCARHRQSRPSRSPAAALPPPPPPPPRGCRLALLPRLRPRPSCRSC